MVELIVIGTIAAAMGLWFWQGRKVEEKVEDTTAEIEVTLPEVEEKVEETTVEPEVTLPEVEEKVEETTVEPEVTLPEVEEKVEETTVEPEVTLPEVEEKVEDTTVEIEVTLPEVEVKVEMPVDKELSKMTKVKLEEFGRTIGVELDRRKTKANMIAELHKKRDA